MAALLGKIIIRYEQKTIVIIASENFKGIG
jgi:hypothetical protein